MLAEAGLSENPFSFGLVIGLLFLFSLVGLLAYLLLQRMAEFLTGRTETSIREILLYTELALSQLLGLGQNGRF
jgi:hypothetical protein